MGPVRAATRVAAAAAAVALAWATPAAADCASRLETTILPLPVYATLPNEGNTFGVMPVFLRVCPDDRRTESIIAPSVTWNDVIQVTGTYRWFYYPTDVTTLTLVASASTQTNYNFLFMWQRLPPVAGAWTDEVTLRLQRSVFFRFFGFGPDTPPEAETSYTGLRLLAAGRRGFNVTEHLNLGLALSIERVNVESIGVPGLPLTPQVFPDAPGIHGATLASQGVELRFDNRRGGDYAERGVRVDVSAGIVEGIAGSPTYFRGAVQVRTIVPELSRLTGAARFAWTGVSSRNAPFNRQSSLGGAYLLRGFTEDRFVDQQSWTVEFEQRLRLLRTEIFGVVADWRIDPFVAAGQVFAPFSDAMRHPHIAAGVGFRAFVQPNVLGRIDVANGSEGWKVYVELGYPY